ncbi:hypothetical protein MBLNU457_4573t2 [Dothideomycetes sp. NU457]
MSKKSEYTSDDLARIRDNQRRSRARRREYTARLEDKIRKFEASSASAGPPTEQLHQAQQENAILRRLLTTLGFNSKFQDMYIASLMDEDTTTAAEQGSVQELSRALSSASMQTVSSTASSSGTNAGPSNDVSSSNAHLVPHDTTHNGGARSSLPDIAHGDQGIDPMTVENFDLDLDLDLGFLDTDYLGLLQEGSSTLGPIDYSSTTPQTLQQPSTTNLPPNSTPASQTDTRSSVNAPTPGPSFHSNSLENDVSLLRVVSDSAANPLASTLCSVAFQILARHNRKGLSNLDLEMRLCAGYVNGRNIAQGCRVQNKVLFSVLAEVS